MVELPDAHFGDASEKVSNWEDYDEPDPDDEELDRTPKDVVMALGFDPKDLD